MTDIVYWHATIFFPLLTVLTLVPLLTMGLVLFNKPSYSLNLGLSGALLNLALSIYLLRVFDSQAPGIHLAESVDFLGLGYRVGVDGTNILFVPLTAVLGLLALVYTTITRHRNDRLFVACLLAYQGILIGAFVALNAMQFWFWCLLELLPVVSLTVSAGTGERRNQVIKTVLQYWLSGLGMSLAGFLLLSMGLMQSGLDFSFDWLTLKHHNLAIPHETLIFILLFFGFAVRMPLFPFHAWLPLLAEHGTAASAAIFLHGLKLGVYALIRFILPLVPGAAEHWASFVVSLGLLGIFYGALLALMQINMRRLLAFAVISHTGMLVIGVFSFNDFALEGSILLSVAYGLATAGMLFSIGLIYERTRTSYLPRLGGLFENNSAIGLLFLISALSTMVMPGTPGFDAAHLLIEGAIEEHGWLIAIAILIGNVMAAGFLLWAFQRLFIAYPRRKVQPYSSIHHPVFQERIIALAICGLLMATGFYTTPWLKFIDQEASEIGEHYPEHHSHHANEPGHD
ncbi:MAG: NADH-quinone oxidoreductase subunit M [Methylomonas sp.]|jgi:NADH-quinone oxidoreductase subunit M|uniref:complex I subunit 4 family protein n=1 Tax=Methylomonas sp. TaxID=418 RepID=UPI0025F09D8F|nr:NADH-quinone oxidoreductase subunit M [Methylomonas sp.]MCK9607009.1 NADH-quinone oxidoreductase subunit M [Methylomonas sp.]